jgi:hypothetical protein
MKQHLGKLLRKRKEINCLPLVSSFHHHRVMMGANDQRLVASGVSMSVLKINKK